ncbi:MAG: anhydro-N-acetylmuramic acid kinase [Bacteroidales bacterium]|jgi:anhydro-N-acetylmuramic acid kinase|nr:anhydro-N-acetylmuramic acid kinase [Bacteroidales bacterium]
MVLDYNVLGLMSGTSADGLDLAFCNFSSSGEKWKLKIKKTKFVLYSSELRRQLNEAHLLDAVQLRKFDVDFSYFIANRISCFLDEINIKPDLIASHGHTIFHVPEDRFTYQVGSGEVLAKLTKIPVVCDFRSGDVALGGQGAPLVPIGDKLLFGDYSACLNLGGFSNISFDNKDGQRIAYDISPVNFILNRIVSVLGMEFDNEGKIAASGTLNRSLLEDLNSLEYYSRTAPKSLSREWVDNELLPVVNHYKNEKTENILHTLTVHIAEKIAENMIGFKNILITGGGTYNKFLIENIMSRTNVEIIIPDKELIDFKEAIIFAFLGLLRYINNINCLASVTGAERDSCCGVLCVP